MPNQKSKEVTFNLRDLAEKWCYSMDHLFYLAEEDKLQICKQQHESLASLFDSNEKREEASKFSKDPIPIYEKEARQIDKYYDTNFGNSKSISLVITKEEKEKFEKENNLISEGGQEDLDSTIHPPEKLPTIIMGPDDSLVWGYERIGNIVNSHKDNLLKLHKKEGLPLYWSAANPYSTKYRLISWVENRVGKKRKTAKNFIKTENPQDK